MVSEDKQLEKFDYSYIVKICKLPIITIYKSPKDYEGKYVARLFDILPSAKPLKYIVIRNSLECIRECIPLNMTNLGRFEKDDKCIVESYI